MSRKSTELLSDEDLAYIATHTDASPLQIAADLGRPYYTVAAARRRIARDGWVCRVKVCDCIVCGELLCCSMQRVVHERCEPARAAERQRGYRQERPGQSTPYVRAWRAEHPERTREMREADKVRMRAEYPAKPAEWRAAMLDRAHEADRDDYQTTLARANSSGQIWSTEEDQYLLDHPREAARESGLKLGRTLWAVRGRRVVLRRRAVYG